MTQKEKLSEIIKALDSKKAENIKAIKIGDLTIIADYFVIANGTSTTHTRGLADEVEFKLGEKGIKPDHIEGFDGASWIAISSFMYFIRTPARIMPLKSYGAMAKQLTSAS